MSNSGTGRFGRSCAPDEQRSFGKVEGLPGSWDLQCPFRWTDTSYSLYITRLIPSKTHQKLEVLTSVFWGVSFCVNRINYLPFEPRSTPLHSAPAEQPYLSILYLDLCIQPYPESNMKPFTNISISFINLNPY
jgi:hypothetical protein